MEIIAKQIVRNAKEYNHETTITLYRTADEIAEVLVNSDGKAMYLSYQAYAINAHSKNKALAWAFLKFLMSKEMQTSPKLWGFPINNAAFDEKMLTHFSDGFSADGTQVINKAENLEAYNDCMKYLNRFIGYLGYFAVTDYIINNMVDAEAARVFNGEKSAQEAAAALQNKVQIYLNE